MARPSKRIDNLGEVVRVEAPTGKLTEKAIKNIIDHQKEIEQSIENYTIVEPSTKIDHLKLSNAIKIGSNEESYFNQKSHNIDLEGMIIRISLIGKPKTEVFTSLMNAISWRDKNPEETKKPLGD